MNPEKAQPTASAIAARWPIYLAIFLVMTGNGLQSSALSLRASELFKAPLEFGCIMSAAYVGLLIGSLISRHAILKLGPRLCLAVALLTLALGFGAISNTNQWAVLVGSRLLIGVSLAQIYVVVESQLNGRATASTRAQIMSIYMASVFLGMVTGQPLLAITDPFSGSSYWMAAMLVILALPCTINIAPITSHLNITPVALTFRQLFRLSPLASMGCLCMGASQGAFFGVGPAFGYSLGLTKSEVGFIMLLGTLGGGLMQWPAGWIADQAGRAVTIAAAAFVSMLVLIIAVLVMLLSPAHATMWTAVLIFVWGATAMPIYPLLLAEANDQVHSGEMIAVSARLILLFGLGAITGPLGATFSMEAFSKSGLYVFLLTISTLIMAIAIVKTVEVQAKPTRE